MGAARISQRDLRNDSAVVLRRVEAGEDMTVTRRGVPVARLSPIATDGDLRCVKPAGRRHRFSELRRVRLEESTEDLLAGIRDER
ncbi:MULTISPECIES: type II toxin-antitoxin system Phd/YefM family antitoxin [Actinomyces]|uniref:Type II toxin-antitoxin system prevent-host-death family antitoxin n=1 Tax=Actinomyces marmotae TaxID=2737173 RepID=A0A6M8B0X1_9ACTO|nr:MULTISPECIES: type II toxin-antitoxin system prevent-host-death family antitoxin [Actinomyces]QKD79878.1 type II toxin-antitoxin system prevent-host-death family antitoxin [Actinomyces marmotae]